MQKKARVKICLKRKKEKCVSIIMMQIKIFLKKIEKKKKVEYMRNYYLARK